jgi:hypothetical protein
VYARRAPQRVGDAHCKVRYAPELLSD